MYSFTGIERERMRKNESEGIISVKYQKEITIYTTCIQIFLGEK